MTQQITGKHVPHATANGLRPIKGPRSVTQSLNFGNGSTSPATVNFAESQNLEKLEFIQTIKIDNSQNAASVSILDNNTNDLLTIPPYAMAILPLLASKQTPNFTVTTTGTALVNLYFLSMALPAVIWFPNGASGSGGSSSFSPAGTIGNDYSSAQPALLGNLLTTAPVNAARNNLIYQNQSNNLHQLVLDDGAGNILSVLLMAAGGLGLQGADSGGFNLGAFKGRVRVYSSDAGDQCMLRDM